jgi:phage tail-like protein
MDPYRVFNYVVEINGTQVGGFSEVTGISADTEFEDFREGGINNYTHKLAKLTKYSNLTLKRGITDANELWTWHQEVINGTVERKTISVILQNEAREETWRWVFSDAYPVKWTGPDLNATSNTVAAESVEFAHHGLRAQF